MKLDNIIDNRMKTNVREGFELYKEFIELIGQFFSTKDLQYNRIIQENSGSQKFIKIELSIKVE